MTRHPSHDACVHWHGLFVPDGAPQGGRENLHQATVAAVKDKNTRERMTALGAEACLNRLNGLAAMTGDEIAKWGKVVRRAGIRPQ
jgi:tripartite-type tricarboxylate transporter receptor subunit TctC